MQKFILLILGILVLNKTNGIPMSSKSLPSNDDDDDYDYDQDSMGDLEDQYLPYTPKSSYSFVHQKRSRPDTLMRRSSLDKNFMRFGRSGFFPSDNCCKHKDLVGYSRSHPIEDLTTFSKRGTDGSFMRFGREDGFIRFGRLASNNFMRFGRGDNDNFMRFGRGGNDDSFMRFGRENKDKLTRFGRGNEGNFMRFGKSSEYPYYPDKDENLSRNVKSDSFMRFGRTVKNPTNFLRYGKSGGRDDGFIRFGKSGKNGTNFLRFGHISDESDKDLGYETQMNLDMNDDNLNNIPIVRRKRLATNPKLNFDKITRLFRNPEMLEYQKKRTIEENILKPENLKFINLINNNHSEEVTKREADASKSLPLYYTLLQGAEKYKRKLNGNAFIRFG